MNNLTRPTLQLTGHDQFVTLCGILGRKSTIKIQFAIAGRKQRLGARPAAAAALRTATPAERETFY